MAPRQIIHVGPYPTFYAIYRDEAGELHRFEVEAQTSRYFTVEQFLKDIEEVPDRELFMLKYEWIEDSVCWTLWVRMACVNKFYHDLTGMTYVRWENHNGTQSPNVEK